MRNQVHRVVAPILLSVVVALLAAAWAGVPFVPVNLMPSRTMLPAYLATVNSLV